MKLNFAKYMGILFAAGLVLCGVGAGVFIAELNSIQYVKADNNTVTDEIIIKLPENEPVYYNREIFGSEGKFNIIEDSSVPTGQIKYMIINHNIKYTDFNTKITKEFYIYDTGNMYISEHTVNYLERLDYIYDDYKTDMMRVKEFIGQIKNRVIVDDTDYGFDVAIKINPVDSNRLIELNDYQELVTYREYLDEYKEDVERTFEQEHR